MKTLGELLKEYEESGGSYPVKVIRAGWGEQSWIEVLAHSRDNIRVPVFNCIGVVLAWDLDSSANWSLWTPPKRVRKEKRFGWIDSTTNGVYAVDSVEHQEISNNPHGWERAPWLDGEVEIEE